MSAAAVLPIRKESLYEIQERLEMLFASEEFIDPADPAAEGLHACLQHEIQQALAAELSKVDGISGYLAFLENQQAFADQEIQRLKLRKARFERRQERIEANVIGLLRQQGRSRIEGHMSYLALKGCPPSLDVLDEDAVPAEYKVTTVTSVTTVDKMMVKRCLKAKMDVPGVRLITDRQKLVRG